MVESGFFVVAVGIGAIVLLAIVWTYVRGQRPANVSVPLAVFGFLLVSSPLWSSIVFKGEGFDVSLVRDCQAQAERTVQLLDTIQAQAPPEKAAALRPLVERARASVEQLKQPTAQPPKVRAQALRETLRVLENASARAASVAKSPPP